MFYENATVLVTGGAGFIGSHFVDALLALGARVRTTIHRRPLYAAHPNLEAVRADLTRQEDCLAACENIDYAIHAAGSVGAAGVGPVGMMASITGNLVQTAQMLEAAWVCGVKRMLVFSSSTAYPPTEHPVREEEMWSGPPYPGYFGYGWMRRYIERLAEFTARNADMGVAICRPTAVYGPRDNFDPATSHVIPALIRRAVARENPFIVWGTGQELRDFLYVTDLIQGCLKLLEKKSDADPVNIGFGQSVSVCEVVNTVLKLAGHDRIKVIFDKTKPSALPVRLVSINKARHDIDFSPEISLQKGIELTVRWYNAQQ